jgi:hypothetical protein
MLRCLAALVLASGTAAAAPCATITDKPATLATASTAGEYTLAAEIETASATHWHEAGNEAVVLEISSAKRGLIGHLILHQGKTKFTYAMHLGALGAGEAIDAKVSPLTAKQAKHEATACAVKLAIATGDDVKHAPIYRWPAQKVFDDVPLVNGWSKSHSDYVTVMTNENGGTAEQCGGGASGMQAEIARWGRSTDIEGHYNYATHTFERCTGKADAKVLRMEGDHPNLYRGDGHNRLFESRAGYGRACGAHKPEKPDGDLDGWNVNAKSDALADDAGRVVILRPVPFDLDALGFHKFGGRREALADHYAPWLYRITSLELAREGKIDNAKTLDMQRYLYVDVQVADVGGIGGTYCAKLTNGGFRIRVVTKDKQEISSPQITKAYASGGGHDWKRVAIALPANVGAAEVDHFVFDAYDKDGIYVTALGDAFIPKPAGDNGATLDYIRTGEKPFTDYVDDDKSECIKGAKTGGPDPAVSYSCVGGGVDLGK